MCKGKTNTFNFFFYFFYHAPFPNVQQGIVKFGNDDGQAKEVLSKLCAFHFWKFVIRWKRRTWWTGRRLCWVTLTRRWRARWWRRRSRRPRFSPFALFSHNLKANLQGGAEGPLSVPAVSVQQHRHRVDGGSRKICRRQPTDSSRWRWFAWLGGEENGMTAQGIAQTESSSKKLQTRQFEIWLVVGFYTYHFWPIRKLPLQAACFLWRTPLQLLFLETKMFALDATSAWRRLRSPALSTTPSWPPVRYQAIPIYQ